MTFPPDPEALAGAAAKDEEAAAAAAAAAAPGRGSGMRAWLGDIWFLPEVRGPVCPPRPNPPRPKPLRGARPRSAAMVGGEGAAGRERARERTDLGSCGVDRCPLVPSKRVWARSLEGPIRAPTQSVLARSVGRPAVRHPPPPVLPAGRDAYVCAGLSRCTFAFAAPEGMLDNL